MRIKRESGWTWGHYIDKKLSQSKSYFPKKFCSKIILRQKEKRPKCSRGLKGAMEPLKKVSQKKLLVYWILSKLPSPPPYLDNLYNFLNAKNVDFSNIQNNSLSNFSLITAEYLLCGSCIQPKNSLKFKLLAFEGTRLPLLTKNALMKR